MFYFFFQNLTALKIDSSIKNLLSHFRMDMWVAQQTPHSEVEVKVLVAQLCLILRPNVL